MTQLDLTFIDVNQCYRMYSAFIIIFSLCAILPLKVKLLSFSQFFFFPEMPSILLRPARHWGIWDRQMNGTD